MPRGARALLVVAAVSAVIAAGCSSKGSGTTTADAAEAPREPRDATAERASGGVDAGAEALDDAAMPASSGEDLTLRMRHLLEAITHNNPDLAGDALFPRDAYIAMSDVADPQKGWDKRVLLPFRRSVERAHKRHAGVERARFVSFEIGPSATQMTPKKKGFKKPLWRVKHSKLTFTIDGKVRRLDIPEMTAWRGAWYVTRLR